MYPKINQNIVLYIKDQDEPFRSVIDEIGKNEILIGFPLESDISGFLPEGTDLVVTYISEGNSYRFETRIIGRKNDRICFYRLAKPQETEIKRIQRRDNFRVYTNLQITVNGTTLSTVNISAGGVLCAFPNDFGVKLEEMVSGTIEVPNVQSKEFELIRFEGQIRRMESEESQDIKYAAIEFTKINQRDQTKIVQYCFERQRQMR